MSNIKDVAKAAGVSVSTVSNILNNKTSVSEELHQKVIIFRLQCPKVIGILQLEFQVPLTK